MGPSPDSDERDEKRFYLSVFVTEGNLQGLMEAVKDERELAPGTKEVALHMAARLGDHRMVSVLLGAGADMTARSDYGEDILQQAACGGNTAVVKMLVDRGHVWRENLEDETGCGHGTLSAQMSPIHIALSKGDDCMVELLIEGGVDAESRDLQGDSPLLAAVQLNRNKSVDLFIKHGCSVNLKGNQTQTPLHRAVQGGNIAMVNTLLEAGGDPNIVDEDGDTALFFAVHSSFIEAIDVLLEAGSAGLYARNIMQQSLLHVAAMAGTVAVVERMLEMGIPVNLRDTNQDTPCILAARKSNWQVLEFLITLPQCKRTLRGERGRGLLHWMSVRGLDEEVYERIVRDSTTGKKACDVNCVDHSGDSALTLASKNTHAVLFPALLAAGANVNHQGTQDRSALHWVVAADDLAATKLLLEAGASPDVPDLDGYTPLILAARDCHWPLLMVLIPRSTDIDAPDNFGKTSLAYVMQAPEAQDTEKAQKQDAERALKLAGADEANVLLTELVEEIEEEEATE